MLCGAYPDRTGRLCYTRSSPSRYVYSDSGGAAAAPAAVTPAAAAAAAMPTRPTPRPYAKFRDVPLGPVAVYDTFRLNFHHFDRFELGFREHTHVQGAAFSCLRFKLADMMLI